MAEVTTMIYDEDGGLIAEMTSTWEHNPVNVAEVCIVLADAMQMQLQAGLRDAERMGSDEQ